ncbi:haloacid dehalogenase type II [Roseococcus sp. DSY-14]|uniref:haloacid dehalogenase type II n=1 Tax=Roseococcus sp. DSY-14 TaxID=3369650 RepID=UPI00387B0A5B
MTRHVVFDAYGTLLDVHSAVARHAPRLGGAAPAISALWRQKQLEYSWVLSATGAYEDFAVLTARALRFALDSHGLRDAALEEALLDAYRRLDAFPDAAPTLARLRAAGRGAAILSNGEPAMLAAGLASAGLALEEVMSVHGLRRYKPHPEVYAMAASRLGAAPQDIAFVSANAWDAFGAARFGFRAFWLNRTGGPVEYGLDGIATPIASLEALP